jgi:hypothetical protein
VMLLVHERDCIAACRRLPQRFILAKTRQKCYLERATFARHWRGISRQRNNTVLDLNVEDALEGYRMYHREFSRMGSVDMRELLDDAWTDFEATTPVGIDLVAEASLRNMIAARLMRAAKAGETDRAALKALALNGL